MPNTSPDGQEREVFLLQLMREKGLAEQDINKNSAAYAELDEQLQEAMEKAMVAALTDEQVEAVNALLDAGQVETATQQVEAAAASNPEYMQRALERFCLEYLDEGASEDARAGMTMTDISQPPVGTPVQGTTSEVQGASDVEGMAKKTIVTEEVR